MVTLVPGYACHAPRRCTMHRHWGVGKQASGVVSVAVLPASETQLGKVSVLVSVKA